MSRALPTDKKKSLTPLERMRTNTENTAKSGRRPFFINQSTGEAEVIEGCGTEAKLPEKDNNLFERLYGGNIPKDDTEEKAGKRPSPRKKSKA